MGDNEIQAPFSLELRGHRIVSGNTIAEVLVRELRAEGISRFMLISSADLASEFENLADAEALAARAGTFTGVIPHVPDHSVVNAASEALECAADGLVVFGGGSALDTAKAVSDRLVLPIIAIPTNFSGSEVTWNYGLTVGGVKQTMRNPAVLARSVIYDPALLASLPKHIAICSGINAVAHAIEALYAPQANPLTRALAETGVRQMIAGLKLFCTLDEPTVDALTACFTGSWLCGEVLSQVGMGFHHRICHVLGGTYGLPHAQAHTVLLPYSIAWNSEHAPALAALSDLFPGRSLARGLAEFSIRHGAPRSLQDLGLRSSQIPQIAAQALATPVDNPHPVTLADVESILARALAGELAG